MASAQTFTCEARMNCNLATAAPAARAEALR